MSDGMQMRAPSRQSKSISASHFAEIGVAGALAEKGTCVTGCQVRNLNLIARAILPDLGTSAS
jgi:hypothetical protein